MLQEGSRKVPRKGSKERVLGKGGHPMEVGRFLDKALGKGSQGYGPGTNDNTYKLIIDTNVIEHIPKFQSVLVSTFLGFLVSKFQRCTKCPFHIFWNILLPYPSFSRYY